jgi:hypothetical protein
MAVMERRLQILLNEDRYVRLMVEAQRSKQSVAAVVRDALDAHLGGGSAKRAAAARGFLALPQATGVEPDWRFSKAALEDDLAARLEQ